MSVCQQILSTVGRIEQQINLTCEHLATMETYKQADKHILFGVVDGSFSIAILVVLLGYEWQVGVLNMVVVEAAVQTGGGLVAVKAMFQITWMAVGRTK